MALVTKACPSRALRVSAAPDVVPLLLTAVLSTELHHGSSRNTRISAAVLVRKFFISFFTNQPLVDFVVSSNCIRTNKYKSFFGKIYKLANSHERNVDVDVIIFLQIFTNTWAVHSHIIGRGNFVKSLTDQTIHRRRKNV